MGDSNDLLMQFSISANYVADKLSSLKLIDERDMMFHYIEEYIKKMNYDISLINVTIQIETILALNTYTDEVLAEKGLHFLVDKAYEMRNKVINEARGD